MRTSATAFILFLSTVAACATATRPDAPDAAPPAPPTLRAQLAAPVRLAIDARTSTGQITAREHQGESWLPATVTLAITAGALEVSRRDPDLVIDAFEVDLAPIALPMLPGDATLTDIAVRLHAPAAIGVTWQDDDDAIALATLDLELVWSLRANGGTLPLGSQPLVAVPLAITLHGATGAASAAIGLDQPGTLWTWADLLALGDLALELPAATAPRD